MRMKYILFGLTIALAVLLGFSPSGVSAFDDALIMYFSFDVKDDYQDETGKHSGETRGNVEWTANGQLGGGISFNGTNAYILVPEAGFETLGQEGDSYTIEAWLKTSQLGNASPWSAPVYLEKRALVGTNRVFMLYFNADNSLGASFENPQDQVNVSTPINDDKWHHTAVVRDGGDVTLYLDGVATEGAITDSDKSTPGEPFTIGCRRKNDGSITGYFSGVMDEVAIYRKALTEAEVKRDMTAGVSAISPKGKLAVTWSQIKSAR